MIKKIVLGLRGTTLLLALLLAGYIFSIKAVLIYVAIIPVFSLAMIFFFPDTGSKV